MKTMTDVLDRENKAISDLRILQNQGLHFSTEYQAAAKEYRSARSARQRLVRQTKKQLAQAQEQLRKLA